jgi:hypothetical protein
MTINHDDKDSGGRSAVAGVSGEAWPAPMLIDAHAHLYDCYDRATYFDSTLANVRRAWHRRGVLERPDATTHTPACLLLAEPANIHAFRSLLKQGGLTGGRWRFAPCSDGLSLIARLDGRDELILIEGRQIKTRENLEVLSLCCRDEVPDGQATVQVIERVIEFGGLPVLPLGVGKWLGSRGRIIDELLNGPLSDKLCLGDNAGRLAMGPTPRHFVEARRRGVWVLPGSGALPFRSQAKRVGRYGLVLNSAVDRAAPATAIKRLIHAGGDPPNTFGRPDGLVDFLKLQLTMQVYNRLRGPDWYIPDTV